MILKNAHTNKWSCMIKISEDKDSLQIKFAIFSSIMCIRDKCVLFLFSNSEKFKDEVSKPETVARVKYETGDAFRLDESKRPKNDSTSIDQRLLGRSHGDQLLHRKCTLIS